MEATLPDSTNIYIELTSRRLLAFFGMIVGMFMAILDIQIVASSISVIGAGLSASAQELSWVQTSYLMAEVVIIPLTGYLSKGLSTRTVFTLASFGFTFSSFLCSTAWNIESMIIFRAFQGLFGGAMIPTVFTTAFTIFPKDKQPYVSVVIGLVASVAPTLGPTIGGYITETLSWHFMFVMNVIPGIFVVTTSYFLIDFDEPDYKVFKNFDFIGLTILIITLISLEYFLEEGASKGWFEDALIVTLASIIFTGLVLFIFRELSFTNPILDLRAFKNVNFTVGCVFSFVIGVGLFSAVYLLPLFLYRVAGLDTFHIGLIMIVTGAFQFISAPFAGNMAKAGVDKRIMLSLGFVLFAIGSYMNSSFTSESRFWELFLPQAIRGFSLMFCFIPINSIALDDIPREALKNASGLYNLMRNLGGAMGLAVMNTYINNTTKIMSNYISANVTNSNETAVNIYHNLSGLFEGKVIAPDIAAYSFIDSIIFREAFLISLNNSFIILACIFFVSPILMLIIKKT